MKFENPNHYARHQIIQTGSNFAVVGSVVMIISSFFLKEGMTYQWARASLIGGVFIFFGAMLYLIPALLTFLNDVSIKNKTDDTYTETKSFGSYIRIIGNYIIALGLVFSLGGILFIIYHIFLGNIL